MEGSSLRRGRPRLRGQLRAVDVLTLAAVALVVLLVSLPRLRDLALRENEGDAVWLMRRLVELCAKADGADLQALVEAEPRVGRLLDDAEFLERGRILRRHGYLFEVLDGSVDRPQSGQEPLDGSATTAQWAVRAWPWEAGRTGRLALLWTPQSGLVGHLNEQAEWSGTRPPSPGAAGAEGWRRIRQR